MRRPWLLCFALALSALVAAPACGDSVIRPSAASVNGREISNDELQAELEAIQANPEYVEIVEANGTTVRGNGLGTLSNAFVGQVLTRQIFLELIHQELVRRKLSVTPAEVAAAEAEVAQSTGGDEVYRRFDESYRETLKRRRAEIGKLQQQLAGPPPDEAAVQRFYDENPSLFAQVCVSHILFAVVGEGGQIDQAATAAELDRLRGEAAAARAEIDAGADFAALAAQRSADVGSKDIGGSLECGPPGSFQVPEFEVAIDALAENEVSPPVQTPFGIHLIKVTSRQPQTLEQAAPQIRERLQAEGDAGLSTFLQEAVGKAKVSVNPRYGRFTTEGPSPGIVPPDAPTTTQPGQQSQEQQAPNPFGP